MGAFDRLGLAPALRRSGGPENTGAASDPPDEDGLEDLYPPATNPKVYGSPSETLVKLWSRGKLPPTTEAEAKRRAKIAITVAALERTQLDDSRGGAFGPNTASREAFWKVNQGFRHLQAWAGPGFADTVVPSPKAAYKHWLDVSEKWKRNRFQPVDQLQSMANALALCQNAAEEYGFPGIYHSDRRAPEMREGEEVNRYADSKGGGFTIDVPSAESRSAALDFASAVNDAAPSWLKPSGSGGPDFWNKIPLAAKIAGGALVAAVVVGQFARFVGR